MCWQSVHNRDGLPILVLDTGRSVGCPIVPSHDGREFIEEAFLVGAMDLIECLNGGTEVRGEHLHGMFDRSIVLTGRPLFVFDRSHAITEERFDSR